MLPWGVQLPQPKRPDGRTSELQLRPTSIELGVLKNAIGSARFKQGTTSALSGVHGPTERSRKSFPQASIQVIVRPLTGATTFKQRHYESCIQSVLLSVIKTGNLSHTSISVILQPEGDDGCLLSCLINAAICSVIDAGLPCFLTALSISLVLKNSSKGFALDPTAEELTVGSEFSYEVSSLIAYTIDTKTGKLIQAAPDCLTLVQAEGIECKATDSHLTSTADEMTTPDLINAAGCAVKVLARLLRQTVEEKLHRNVFKTVATNNFFQIQTDK